MISKGIVVVPTHGFANRLRFLAAALHVFKGQAPAFYIDWRSDPHFSCDGPSSLFARPPKGYRAWVTKADYEQRKCLCYGDRVHMVQVLQKLQEIKEKKYEYLVLIGGHQPLYPSAQLLPWLRHKHNFYSKGIRWSARVLGVAQAILDTVDRAPSEIVAVHARIISKKFDAADVQANPESMDFNANSPPERFRDLILGLQAGTPVLLFSNDESVARWLERACRAKGSKAVLHHASSSSGGDRLSDAGIVRAVGEYVAMSRCGMILGTGMSSFSDEASFVHSIPKVLVLRKGIEDKMLTRYHANNLCRTPLGLLCLNAGPAVIKFFEKLL